MNDVAPCTMIEVARKYGVELTCTNSRQQSDIDSKKERERQSLSLSQVTQADPYRPDWYGLLQKILVDVRLLCTFHLDQANGALCNAEDCMVNIDIGSRHFSLKFCHGRATSRHDSGLDVLQW